MSGLDVRNGNDPDVVPLTPQQQAAVIRRAANRQGIAPSILWGLYGAETDFGKNVQTSGAGALGPFQFMPDTAKSYGINPNNFRQAANAAAKYLATYKGRGTRGMLAAYNAGPQGNPNNPETAAYVPKVLQLAKTWQGGGGSGGGGARGGGQAGAQILLGGGDPGTVPQGSEGILSLVEQLTAKPQQPQSAGLQAPAVSAAPAMPQGARLVQAGGGPAPKPDIAALLEAVRTVGGDVPGGASGGQEAVLPGAAGSAQGNGQAGGGKGARGVVAFDGKPVRSDFARQLAWARAHGWKGSVTSGFRSKPEQMAAAKRFGLQHYGAAGPLGSNHVVGHQGAVDVSDPDALDKILRRYPGKRTLHRGMADDPVHFSPTGH